nr:hypothetical protein [Desulforhopalus sp. IMCC35007]
MVRLHSNCTVFQNHSHVLAATNTQRSQTKPLLLTLHLVHQGHKDTRTGTPNGMPQTDIAAKHVGSFNITLELALAGHQRSTDKQLPITHPLSPWAPGRA